jgi:hypothetical protein
MGVVVATDDGDSTGGEATKCIASFDYEAVEADELTLKEGHVYVVLEKASSDWWRGHAEGEKKVGLFPCAYVKEVLQSNGDGQCV